MTSLFADAPTQTDAAQPYRVLARKYRPSTFAELIGQEAMVRTLTNAIQSGRLPQAWMLTGVRGIGKTTTARLIAKALNCTGRGADAQSIEPCGRCEACRAIAEDRHVDVQELDAASRTGVGDIREIIDSVRYGPVSAAYKIYILDEVHMLSNNAFNALLKTLEEPPPHTKFIFATTEIRKVPVTVLSRCQRFDLRRIDSAALAAHFAGIADKEGVTHEDDAIRLIAHAADGSVRDGLSLLDQAIALGDGAVRAAEVKAMLGLADRAAGFLLCGHVLRGEMEPALTAFEDILKTAGDPLQTLQDLAMLVHRLTRAQILTSGESFSALPEADRQFLRDLADIKIPALARAWQILVKGIAETQLAPQPAMAAEMVLIRLAYAATLPTPGDLMKQIKNDSETPATLPVAPGGPRGGGTISRFGNVETVAHVQAIAAPAPVQTQERLPQTFRELVALFADHREGGLYAQLSSYAHPVRMSAGKLELRLEKKAAPNLASLMAKHLQDWTGRRWMIAVVDEAGGPTLDEEDRERERVRLERAQAHPLMQSVTAAFPQATLVSLKTKPKESPLPEASEADAPLEPLAEDDEEE